MPGEFLAKLNQNQFMDITSLDSIAAMIKNTSLRVKDREMLK